MADGHAVADSPLAISHQPSAMKLGLIAGNGRFPFLVLDAARGLGHDVTVIAIKEKPFRTSPTRRRARRPRLCTGSRLDSSASASAR